MTPLFTTIEDNLRIMIVPDNEAPFDTPAAPYFTYNIYEDNIIVDDEGRRAKEASLLITDKNDPAYIGNIVFQKASRIYTFNTAGHLNLSYMQINQIIETITAYRQYPPPVKFNF